MADSLTINNGKFVLIRDWENSGNNPGDKLTNSPAGYIPYFQESSASNRNTYISNEVVYNGSKSVKFLMRETPTSGSTTTDVWRSGFGFGVDNNALAAHEGDEFWCRCRVYLTSNWDWKDGNMSNPALKLFRVNLLDKSYGEIIVNSDNYGRVYVQSQGFDNGNFELNGGTNGALYGAGSNTSLSGPERFFPVGRWFNIEVYAKTSATPATAMARVWLDDELILARDGNTAPYTGKQLLTASSGTVRSWQPGLVLFSTWDLEPTVDNGDQSCYFDSIVFTNDSTWIQTNGRQDSHGNWLIGRSYGAPVPTVGIPTISTNPIVGRLVTLSSTAAYHDPATDVDVSFYDGDPNGSGVLIGTDTSTPFSVNWNPNTSGAHSIYAKATDDNVPALSAVSSPLAVTVGDVPTVGAPVVSGVLTVGNTLTLTASVTLVAPATSATVRFYDSDDVLIGTDTSSPYSVTYAPTLAKSYGVYAVATDDTGLVATSSTTHFTMASANPATVDSLRTEIKEGAVTNGIAALAAFLDASPFKLPGGSTDNEKIINALIPLLTLENLRERSGVELYPNSTGTLRSSEFARLTYSSSNALHMVNKRIRELHDLADSTSNLTTLQSILDEELTKGWPAR